MSVISLSPHAPWPRLSAARLRSPALVCGLVCLVTVGVGAAVALSPVAVGAVAAVALVGAILASRTTPYLFAGLVFLQPLLPTSQRPLPFVGLNLQEWALVAGVVLGSALLLGQTLAANTRGAIRLHWLDRIALGLLLWTALSLLQANDLERDLRVFARNTLFAGEMYVLGRWFWKRWPPHRVAAVLAAAGVATSVLLWVEYLAGQPLFVSEQEYLANWVVGGFRAGSMLNGPNAASNYLAQVFTVTVWMCALRQARQRWLWGGAALVIASALVATQSISGVIQFATGVLVLAWPRLSWKARIALVFLTCGVMASPIPQLVTENPLIASHSLSVTGRFDLLETARNAIGSLWADPSSLVFGIGYGREAVIEARFGVGTVAGASRDISLHNAPLTLAIESGLPAAALYLGLLLSPIAALRRTDRSSQRFVAGAAAAVTFVASFTGTIVTLPQVLGMCLFMLAGAASTAHEPGSIQGAAVNPGA